MLHGTTIVVLLIVTVPPQAVGLGDVRARAVVVADGRVLDEARLVEAVDVGRRDAEQRVGEGRRDERRRRRRRAAWPSRPRPWRRRPRPRRPRWPARGRPPSRYAPIPSPCASCCSSVRSLVSCACDVRGDGRPGGWIPPSPGPRTFAPRVWDLRPSDEATTHRFFCLNVKRTARRGPPDALAATTSAGPRIRVLRPIRRTGSAATRRDRMTAVCGIAHRPHARLDTEMTKMSRL